MSEEQLRMGGRLVTLHPHSGSRHGAGSVALLLRPEAQSIDLLLLLRFSSLKVPQLSQTASPTGEKVLRHESLGTFHSQGTSAGHLNPAGLRDRAERSSCPLRFEGKENKRNPVSLRANMISHRSKSLTLGPAGPWGSWGRL